MVKVGDTVTVTVAIQDATDILSYEIDLDFNGEILDYVSQAKGDFLDGMFIEGVQKANKIAQIAEIRIPPEAAASGSGDLFSVTFRAKASGTSVLTLDGISLYYPSGDKMVGFSIGSGSVSVQGGGAQGGGQPGGDMGGILFVTLAAIVILIWFLVRRRRA
jgi:hypothetical protein